MKKVEIIGAGFSGMTLAYYLHQLGVDVVIYEEKKSVGGLIHTEHSSLGLIETAANALMSSPRAWSLAQALGVKLLKPQPEAKNRYIFAEGRAQRWPLSRRETLNLIFKFVGLKFKSKDSLFLPGESVENFVLRHFSAEVLEKLIAPALQGIYAGDVKRMSAALTLGRFFKKSVKDPQGLDFSSLKAARPLSLSPEKGMGQLIERLENYLRSRGVKIHRGMTAPQASENLRVWCTSAWSAAETLRESCPQLAEDLASVESLGLVSVTQFYESQASHLRGFGCLFTAAEKFNSRGVLFSSQIFKNRSYGKHSETWILGGALHPEMAQTEDSAILKAIATDRERLFGKTETPLESHITRWPKALPHYTLAWEKTLAGLQIPDGVYLHGNYLGRIGLSQILDRSFLLAQRIFSDAKEKAS